MIANNASALLALGAYVAPLGIGPLLIAGAAGFVYGQGSRPSLLDCATRAGGSQ
ncbi:MAG TPA: hypothetical protein VGJ91_00245 [Polyangiaceae bacterium]